MTAESDLRVASLQDCAVLELRRDLTISHISQSWEQLTGRPVAEFLNKPVSGIIQGTEADQHVFANAIAEMQNQSFRIVFPSFGGDLEAQGILTEGDELPIHSLWVLRPYQGRLGGSVSEELKKEVGASGTHVLELFFSDLRAAIFENRNWYPAPRRVLCRICENYVPDWWLERHTESCTIENTLETRILEAHDRLGEHRGLLLQLAIQGREYKGVSINRKRSFSHQFAVRVSSPLATRRPSSSDPVQTVINSLISIVDLAMALGEESEEEYAVDDEERLTPRPPTNYSSSPPSPTDTGPAGAPAAAPSGEPGSPESRSSTPDYSSGALTAQLKRIKKWTPPETNQPGLRCLIEDTNALIQTKANLVLRMNNYLQLVNKVLAEVEAMVSRQVDLITMELPASGVASSATSVISMAVDDTDDDMEIAPHYRLPPGPGPTSGPSSGPGSGSGPASSGPAIPAAPWGSSSPSFNPSHPSLPIIPALKPTLSITVSNNSPGNSPWQSPLTSPRLGPYPPSTTRRLSRSMSIVSTRDRSISIASSEDSIPRSKTPKAKPPGISDYEIVSPISKGAFATVYLTRKKLTGEYFAMKCLKKSEVLAMNQATNVRSERAILITTADSPYVAKLYFTFQSREYLYLVMEYVNGGDCASLLGALTCLSEDWAKQYIAETITAVDSVHQQNIIHRDLKPDNLLIDGKGHLKLSDFGLSTKSAVKKHLYLEEEEESNSLVGTPDYMAPETVRKEAQGEDTDWWAVGCILYEFLYGIPPFNDETPDKIFENILEGKVQWPELPPEHDISPCAKDIIKKLLTTDRTQRLGHRGVEEIKSHEFFKGLDWVTLFSKESSFTPEISRPDQTDYFDGRGATMPDFSSELHSDTEASLERRRFSSTGTVSSDSSSRRASRLEVSDEFGPFSYKNVGLLERQNHELISRIRTEADLLKPRRLSMSSPISSSGANANSYWESAVHDSSPFASDTEDTATRTAALTRVHQRRLERKSSSYMLHSPRIVPDVLICVSNPVWRYSLEKLLRDLGCQVVSCSSGDEAIRRGSSTVPFDIIFIDRNLSSGLQPHDIAHILHLTVNANSSTPIILITPSEKEADSLFAGWIPGPVTKDSLIAALKTHCNWQPARSGS